MRVDIVNLIGECVAVKTSKRKPHTAYRPLARWGDHVMPIRIRTIANKLGIDSGTPSDGAIHILENDHAATASNHETIPVGIIGA